MKTIYLALMMLALSGAVMAQTIGIGTDLTEPSGSQWRSPWSPLYGYSYVQTIYLQSEINTVGSITSLRFNYSGPSLANSDVITVWMGTIVRSEFASETDWEPLANLTQVFQGTVTYTTLPGIVTVNLNTPFTYQNTGNLIIAIDENGDGFSEGSSFFATDMGTARTIYFNDDEAVNNPDPASPPEGDGIRPRVANIEIVFGTTTPVTLSRLSAEKVGTENRLTWITQSEQNIKGFELQRSSDGTSFTSLDFIKSKTENGSSNATLSYNFTDIKPLPGNNYYRLKLIDADGKSTFSKIVMLKGSFNRFALDLIYPNPAKNDLNIILSSPRNDRVTILIADIAGKVIFKTASSVLAGDNKIHINPSGFAAGTYTVKAVYEASKESITSKFVKH